MLRIHPAKRWESIPQTPEDRGAYADLLTSAASAAACTVRLQRVYAMRRQRMTSATGGGTTGAAANDWNPVTHSLCSCYEFPLRIELRKRLEFGKLFRFRSESQQGAGT